jgi:hypothetical protein
MPRVGPVMEASAEGCQSLEAFIYHTATKIEVKAMCILYDPVASEACAYERTYGK